MPLHPPHINLALPDGSTYTFDMIYVEGGNFIMGSESAEAYPDEKPLHKVMVDSFYISKYPVTQALWKAVQDTSETPAFFKGNDRPMEMVSWNDAQDFIQKLNHKTRRQYTLPTEAQWEFAARGGIQSKGYTCAGGDKLHEVAWFRENSHKETKPVGLKQPNELGIYDMAGNVWEWCQDWYANDYYKNCHQQGTVNNPQGPASGAGRVLRGGSWNSNPQYCRSAYRYSTSPENRGSILGFRLVCLP